MRFVTYLFLIIVCVQQSVAQDERFYRKIFTGELYEKDKEFKAPKITVNSKDYVLDLNRDGVPESIVTQKIDGIDFIKIKNYHGKVILKKKLDTKAKLSSIFKIQLKTLSNDTDILVIYFYEGRNQVVKFEATAKLYFITIHERNLEKIYFKKGPHFFHEFEDLPDKYWARRFKVSLFDYDNNGIKEILIKYSNISRVYVYKNEGIWTTL